jgi:glutathione reductase (NADPH)
MLRKFDLIVIGTGSAASTVAYECRNAGWEVAIIDSRPFGGTCALRGCDPKKVLVGVAEVVDSTKRLVNRGVAPEASIDWPALMQFKRTFTEPVPENREKAFLSAGIAPFHGRAHFVDQTSVAVGEDTLLAKHIVIATGARPATLNIPGEELVTTSDKFLELDELPKRIVFIGGGYISFEFAHVSSRAGALATIVHRGRRPLEGFDFDLVDQLAQATRDLGVDIRLNAVAKRIEKATSHLSVAVSVEGIEQKIEADMVVHGAGRVPEIDDLDLDKAAIRSNDKGVEVNEYLQSVSNPNVYAAGDAAASGSLPLTPVAAMEGRIVAANLLKGNHAKPNYAGVSTVVFTIPPLASVGLQEKAARDKGLKFKVNRGDTSGWYSSRRVNLKHSGFKVLVEEGSGSILGAHLLGLHAEEVINLFALAIRSELHASVLQQMPYAYPTSSSDVAYMA